MNAMIFCYFAAHLIIYRVGLLLLFSWESLPPDSALYSFLFGLQNDAILFLIALFIFFCLSFLPLNLAKLSRTGVLTCTVLMVSVIDLGSFRFLEQHGELLLYDEVWEIFGESGRLHESIDLILSSWRALAITPLAFILTYVFMKFVPVRVKMSLDIDHRPVSKGVAVLCIVSLISGFFALDWIEKNKSIEPNVSLSSRPLGQLFKVY